jgi:hypothetical protein
MRVVLASPFGEVPGKGPALGAQGLRALRQRPRASRFTVALGWDHRRGASCDRVCARAPTRVAVRRGADPARRIPAAECAALRPALP